MSPLAKRHDRDRRLRRHGRGDDRRPAPRQARRARPGRRQPSAAGAARAPRARVRHPDGRVATSRRSRAPTSILFGIKPQMLGKVGREIGPHLRRGQLVLSVLAGATTAALTGILGHDQVVRSMPNTPARLGKGMTVWYATPETTDDQRAQAAALLGALGAQLEVDDEKMVAMATAVSAAPGPTYVFLVMEALIDAAVHLGFPRHIAHDLVIETLEGSTLFAKQSGMHPAELRNMVTSPGGTSAAALHELESGRLRTVLSEAVWAAFRRTVELGEQLEAVRRRSRRPAEARRSMSDGRHVGGRGPAARAAGRRPRPSTCASPRPRPLGRRGGPVGPPASRRGPGSTTRHGTCPAPRRPTPAGRTGRWPSTSATSPRGRSSRSTTRRRRSRRARWPTDADFDGGDFDTLQRTAPRSPGRSMPRDEILARLDGVARRGLLDAGASALRRTAIRGDAAWGWVYLTLHGHYLDHLGVIEPWTDALRVRQIDGDPFVDGPARRRPRRRSGAQDARDRGRPRHDSSRPIPPERWDAGDVTPGWTAARPPRPPRRLGRGGRRGRSTSTTAAATGWPIRTRASTPGTSGWSPRRAARARSSHARPGTTRRATALLRRGRHPDARRAALARRLELGLRLPPRPRPQAPGDARAVVPRPLDWPEPARPDGRRRPRPPAGRPDDRGDRRGRAAARVPPPPARPGRRLHRRGRPARASCSRCRSAAATRPS